MMRWMNIFSDKHPSLIIFDMDGVIADTAESHKLAWRRYLARFDKPFTDEDFLAVFGTGNKELCPILFPERQLSNEEIERIGMEKEAMFRSVASGRLTTYPGFYEFLDACKAAGIPLAVGSSACRDNVDFVLEELNIADRFRHTVSASDAPNAKPAPDIFLKAAALAGVAPAQCLVLEDSLMGIRAGQAAGMTVTALATTHAAHELTEADHVVKDFLNLL